MEFVPLAIANAYLVVLQPHVDERGYFARAWDSEELRERGLASRIAQSSLSHNRRRGTLRGLHYQAAPHEEAKFVTCVRGAIWDVIADLRQDSPTFLQWHGEELSADNLHGLYIPEGCAHGFLTRLDDSTVLYQISTPFEPEGARGVRWNDPAFGIEWPDSPTLISDRDSSYLDFIVPTDWKR
jgi:dTDP-4-dehydrorhamnose 3,5-epimerase